MGQLLLDVSFLSLEDDYFPIYLPLTSFHMICEAYDVASLMLPSLIEMVHRKIHMC